MKSFLRNTYVLAIETLIFIISIYWYLEKYEKEPLISVISFGSAIIANLFLKVDNWLSLKKNTDNKQSVTAKAVNDNEDSRIKHNNDLNLTNNLPPLTHEATSLFYQRMCDAFPGRRGLSVIDNPKMAIKRLEILLQKPLVYKYQNDEYATSAPFWWFRGISTNSIESFKRLSKTKCLINYKEIEIDKLYIYRDAAYYKEFIYILAKPEKQTGLYKFTDAMIKDDIKECGYSSEEYALLNNKPITRREYDDGSAEIKGKIVDASDAELRVRFLSPYNFIITSQFSPINNSKYDIIFESFLNNILKGTEKVEKLAEFVKPLGRNRHDD